MENSNNKFLSYPDNRDVVFVLGAGASHPDGVPLQKQILPLILEDDIIAKSEIGKTVLEFIKDNYKFNSEKSIYPDLESVFGFLDYFIQQNESFSAEYTVQEIRHIKESLIKLIHHVVNQYTDKKSYVYHMFWDAIKNYNSNVSILTLNYDTLLEQAFDSSFETFGYLDYCIHLMNYDKRDELQKFRFWIDPREPVKVADGESPVPIKIIKLHGSLNWKYCNCCNQTLLTPWNRDIDLNRGKFTGYTYPEKEKYEFLCPLDGTEFETLILAPSFSKRLNQPVISQLMSEAAKEIRSTKKIIFVGYSLSDADVHIRALFKKQLEEDVKVIVINTRNAETLKLKYQSLTDNIEFINASFEEMVSNHDILDKVFDS
ncbi:MAG: SIR2 family protein [Bacteroidota bacterium]